MNPGDIYTTNHGNVIVLEYASAKHVLVRFENTGHEKVTRADHIRSGLVKDRTSYLLYGVGKSVSPTNKKSYRVWADILRRCYDKTCKSYHRYGGRGVYCCTEWLTYETFEKWYDFNYIENYELDKDILSPSEKLYSPDTCVFVPKRINVAILLSERGRGDMPIGVTYHKNRNKCFCARLKMNGVYKNLGYYHTKEDAFYAYKKEKEKFIKQVALDSYENGGISQEVFEALNQWCVNIDS